MRAHPDTDNNYRVLSLDTAPTLADFPQRSAPDPSRLNPLTGEWRRPTLDKAPELSEFRVCEREASAAPTRADFPHRDVTVRLKGVFNSQTGERLDRDAYGRGATSDKAFENALQAVADFWRLDSSIIDCDDWSPA